MRESDINRLITDEVDKIEDTNKKQFIQEILAFERSKMDRDQPRYTTTYHDFVDDYSPGEE